MEKTMKIDCYKCEHCSYPRKGCKFNFRKAADKAGQAIDDIADVYYCQDFYSILNNKDTTNNYIHDEFNTFVKPEKPFLVFYTVDDVEFYVWLKNEGEVKQFVDERVKMYSDRFVIIDGIEIGSLRTLYLE